MLLLLGHLIKCTMCCPHHFKSDFFPVALLGMSMHADGTKKKLKIGLTLSSFFKNFVIIFHSHVIKDY